MAVPKEIDNFQYRRAEQGDIEVLTELLCELHRSHSREEILAENKELLGDKKQVMFLALDGTKHIGVCHASLRSEYVNGKEYAGTAGYLEAIYVRSEYRLHGVAASLVSMCEKWALSSGCRELLSDYLLGNTGGQGFHRQIGFAETERCVFFRKELAPCITEDNKPYTC